MKIKPIKTRKVTSEDNDLFAFLDEYVADLKENSVVVITSKIVALFENSFLSIEGNNKDELIEKQAELFLPKASSKYNLYLTIKQRMFSVSAGIDESNADGKYLLLPQKPQETANQIRKYLRQKFNLKNLGVIITDSVVLPLRRGTVGVSLAHSGFVAVKDYTNQKDLFERDFIYEKSDIADGLASSAVVCMGEGRESQPLAVLSDLDFVEFKDQDPTREELDFLSVDLEEDVFGHVLKNEDWRKGEGEVFEG
jgi:F420-0:gamma-glutamyl ligase